MQEFKRAALFNSCCKTWKRVGLRSKTIFVQRSVDKKKRRGQVSGRGVIQIDMLITLNRPDLALHCNYLAYLYHLHSQMLSLWEVMGFMTPCACFKNLAFVLKAPVSDFFSKYSQQRLEKPSQCNSNPCR